MKTSNQMIEKKTYITESRDGTCANFYTKTMGTVVIETMYRYAKSPPDRVLSLENYDLWVSTLN